MSEDGVEGVMGLNVMLDSVEPLGVVVSDSDKFFPLFKMKLPQPLIVSPVVC
jgi:hypothetical protein